MTAATVKATREDLLAEYVIRDAISLVGNRISLLLDSDEKDIYGRLPGANNEALVDDERCDSLFCELFRVDDDPESTPHPRGVEAHRASAEACYLGARILRTIVYRVGNLREESDYLFPNAERLTKEANDWEGGDDAS